MKDRDYSYDDTARRFRRQLRSTLITLGVLFAINAISNWGHSEGRWWVQWPALGLGISLAFLYKRMLDQRDDVPAMAFEEHPPLGVDTQEDDLTRRAEALAARERST